MKDCNDKHAVVTVFERKIVVAISFPTNMPWPSMSG